MYDPLKYSWRLEKADLLISARNCVTVATPDNNTIIVIKGTSGGSGIEKNKAYFLDTEQIVKIVPNQ